jgi:hypothetical protein
LYAKARVWDVKVKEILVAAMDFTRVDYLTKDK